MDGVKLSRLKNAIRQHIFWLDRRGREGEARYLRWILRQLAKKEAM